MGGNVVVGVRAGVVAKDACSLCCTGDLFGFFSIIQKKCQRFAPKMREWLHTQSTVNSSLPFAHYFQRMCPSTKHHRRCRDSRGNTNNRTRPSLGHKRPPEHTPTSDKRGKGALLTCLWSKLFRR